MLHDRYAIYELRGKSINATIPNTKDVLNGVVEDVYRNIMTDRIELKVKSDGKTARTYCLDEPDIIMKRDEGVFFVYGDPLEEEETDDEMFQEFREMSYTGGTLGDALEKTRRKEVSAILFRFEN